LRAAFVDLAEKAGAFGGDQFRIWRRIGRIA
jgi:hypothetical protein